MVRSRLNTRVNKTLYQVGMATLITSVLWTGFGIYHALVKPPEVDVSAEVLRPINPTIDTKTLDELAERVQLSKFVDQYLGTVVIFPDFEGTGEEAVFIPGEELDDSVETTSSGSFILGEDEEASISASPGL